jgi:hypothetical protein
MAESRASEKGPDRARHAKEITVVRRSSHVSLYYLRRNFRAEAQSTAQDDSITNELVDVSIVDARNPQRAL